MSDTPRTDAAIILNAKKYSGELVTAEFARGLEREIKLRMDEGKEWRDLDERLASALRLFSGGFNRSAEGQAIPSLDAHDKLVERYPKT